MTTSAVGFETAERMFLYKTSVRGLGWQLVKGMNMKRWTKGFAFGCAAHRKDMLAESWTAAVEHSVGRLGFSPLADSLVAAGRQSWRLLREVRFPRLPFEV